MACLTLVLVLCLTFFALHDCFLSLARALKPSPIFAIAYSTLSMTHGDSPSLQTNFRTNPRLLLFFLEIHPRKRSPKRNRENTPSRKRTRQPEQTNRRSLVAIQTSFSSHASQRDSREKNQKLLLPCALSHDAQVQGRTRHTIFRCFSQGIHRVMRGLSTPFERA